MTVRAIAGLVALNAGFALLGLSLLWAARGFTRWTEIVRLAGLGHLLGVALFGILWTQLLVVGVPFGGWAIAATLVGGAVVAGVVALALGRPLPLRGAARGPAATAAAAVTTAIGLALTGLLLEAFFRAGRLQSLQAYDAWAFWVPKAKAIYYFDGLDPEVFTTLAGPTYPPLDPILDAAAFHALGGIDTVTFHLQYWFVVVAAVGAVAGCLQRYVAPWLLWPPLLLVLVVPRFGAGLLTPQADILVDLLFVVAALLLALWVRDGMAWRAVAAIVLLGGATLTKREGILFAAAAVSVAALASWGRKRAWAVLVFGAVAIVAAALPWRLWYRSHGIGGEAPPDGGVSGSLDRAADALRLSADVALDTGLWSVTPLVALIALGAALLWGDRRAAAFYGLLATVVFFGGAWITYSFPDLPITRDEAVNPIVRYTGALVLLAAVATPVLLQSVWYTTRGRDR